MPGLYTTLKQLSHRLHQGKTKEQHQPKPQCKLVVEGDCQPTSFKNANGGMHSSHSLRESAHAIPLTEIIDPPLTNGHNEQASEGRNPEEYKASDGSKTLKEHKAPEEHKALKVNEDCLVNNFEKLEIPEIIPSTMRILEIIQQLWVRYDPTDERSHAGLIEALGAYLDISSGSLLLGKYTSPRPHEKTCEVHIGPLYLDSLNPSHDQYDMQVVRVITLFTDKPLPLSPPSNHDSSPRSNLSCTPRSNSVWQQQPAVILGRMTIDGVPTKWVVVLGKDRILYALWASAVDKRELSRYGVLDDCEFYLLYGSMPDYYSEDDDSDEEDSPIDNEDPNHGWTNKAPPECIVKRLGCISELTKKGLDGFDFKDGGVHQVVRWESELAPLH